MYLLEKKVAGHNASLHVHVLHIYSNNKAASAVNLLLEEIELQC